MEPPPSLAMPPRIRFSGISSAAFEHPADRAALEALRRTPGLDRLLRWLSDIGAERLLRIMFTGDSLRISPRQCPRLYDDLREACAILDVAEPELYLTQYPIPNAFSFGMQRHTIVLTTTLVDLLSDTERLGVIGHELGHIKTEHMLYRSMAILLGEIMREMATNLALPGALFTKAIAYALYEWFRKSELSADRAELLTVQDPSVCVSSMLKLIGGTRRLEDDLNPDEFVRQADQFDDMDDTLLGVYYKFMLVRWRTHPFPATRAREVQEWAKTEQYLRLLRGDYPRADTEAGLRSCAECGATVSNVTFQFCPECGAPLKPVTASTAGRR